LRSKEEDTIEILESIIEENSHELGRKEEDIVGILESTIKKSENEWGSMVKDIAEIKKILLEQINASKENKNDTNQVSSLFFLAK
jgi:hypothetical protein